MKPGDEIINALEEDRVVLAYQPIISCKITYSAHLTNVCCASSAKTARLSSVKGFIPDGRNAREWYGCWTRRALKLADCRDYTAAKRS